MARIAAPHDRHGTLVLTVGADGPTELDLRTRILTAGLTIVSLGVSYDTRRKRAHFVASSGGGDRGTEGQQPPLVDELGGIPALRGFSGGRKACRCESHSMNEWSVRKPGTLSAKEHR